jgi:hypothetical protein
MANEKDPRPAPPVEGATKQFTLKMSGWLQDLAADLDAPAGAPTPAPEASIDQILGAAPAAPEGEEAIEELSLEAALFPSDPPPKP